MDGAANHFPARNTPDYRILHTQSETCSIGNTHGPPQWGDPRSGGTPAVGGPPPPAPTPNTASDPPSGARTQMPISACLASVPTVHVLRNGQCFMLPPTQYMQRNFWLRC